MSKVKTMLDGLRIGGPVGRGNVWLVPLFCQKEIRSPLEYLLAGQALDSGLLVITERDEQGSTGEVLAVNNAALPVLLIDGEELVGANQNRVLRSDVLLNAQSRAVIPVYCAEKGRWEPTRPHFELGVCAPPLLRTRITALARAVDREADDQSDGQTEVWSDINSLLARSSASSPTSAMSDAIARHEDVLDSFVNSLSCPAQAVGAVAVVNGQFVGLDVFDKPRTLQQMWPRITKACAADAVGRPRPIADGTADFTATAVLHYLRQATCDVTPAVDLGENWCLEGPDIIGRALVVDGVLIHLSAFPATPEQRERRPGDRPAGMR